MHSGINKSREELLNSIINYNLLRDVSNSDFVGVDSFLMALGLTASRLNGLKTAYDEEDSNESALQLMQELVDLIAMMHYILSEEEVVQERVIEEPALEEAPTPVPKKMKIDQNTPDLSKRKLSSKAFTK